MAEYTIEITTPRSCAEAFAFLADLRNLPQWDPNVVSVEQAVGDGAGVGTEFEVTVQAEPEPMTLRYRTLVHEAPERLVIEATSPFVSSHDEANVVSADDGAHITYTADLRIAGMADGQVAAMIGAIADHAASGLAAALDGRRVR